MVNRFSLPETPENYSVTYSRDSEGIVTVDIHRKHNDSHFAVWDAPLTEEQWMAWMYYAITNYKMQDGLVVLEEKFFKEVLTNHQTEQGESNV